MTVERSPFTNESQRVLPDKLPIKKKQTPAVPSPLGEGQDEGLKAPNRHSARTRAFTLIELILVMALLIITISLITPRVKEFFGGRTLDAEARRFVSLTHYGQSRAVSEGIPMLLWIDPAKGTYGLEQETGYTDGDRKAMDYSVGEGLKINVDKSGAKAPARGKFYGIHFSPDGNINTAASIKAVSLQDGSRAPIWIKQTGDGLNYALQP